MNFNEFSELTEPPRRTGKLINAFDPANAIPEKKIKKSKFPFQCMENIQLFTEHATKLGVAKHETFQSVDLFEKQNLYSVLICLSSLARKAHKFGKSFALQILQFFDFDRFLECPSRCPSRCFWGCFQ